MMKALHMIAFILVVIGALNWGLVGFFKYDLVAKIFGDMTMISRIIYDLVGLSGLLLLFTHWGDCKKCETKPAQPVM